MLKVRFTYEESNHQVEATEVIYKNETKIGVLIPDMGEQVPLGHQQINVEISLNGQQYTKSGLKFLFNSLDPNLTEEELKKLDEAEEKANKGKKKK